MKKNEKLTSRLYLTYILTLIPFILFGLYKNGYELYKKDYINLLESLKPLIIIFMSIVGTILGILIKTHRKTKKWDINLETLRWPIIESIILASILPLKTSPIIIFIITIIGSIFLKNTRLNKIAILYILISLINHILGLDSFLNIYQSSKSLNYNGIDLFLGLGVGGICSTSILLVTVSLIALSFNNLYKKDLVITSIIVFLLFGIISNMISGEYLKIFEIIFGYNVLFIFVFIAPNLYSSSYTMQGQMLSGIVLGTLTYFLLMISPYNAAIISILVVNLLSGIFDRIFVIK